MPSLNHLHFIAPGLVVAIAGALTGQAIAEPFGIHACVAAEDIFYGPAPETDEDFKLIAEAGVTTVISVDGAKTKVDLAESHGLQYRHIPMGYDAIPTEAQAAIAKAVRASKGSVYIHCHHGRHRAPAAAAIAIMATRNAEIEDGVKLLESGGTSPDYVGLWRDVRSFEEDAIADMDPELFAQAPVPDFVTAMADLSRYWDVLKACEKNNWEALATAPDVTPVHQALIVAELFREMERQVPDAPYVGELVLTTEAAENLYEALRTNDYNAANDAFRIVRESCSSCHNVHRN